MELAEVFAELVAELKARVEIQQLKELKAFDSLRLSIEDTTEATAEIAAEVFVKLAGRTKLI